MATTSLTRTMTAGDRDKFTVSAWVKRGILGAAEYYWSCYTDASNYSSAFFDTDNTLHWYNRSGGGAAGQQLPSNYFRDVGAWYHIVTVWDSAASAADRMRIYVNGDEVTSFLVDGNPTSGQDSQFGNSGSNMYLGQRGDAGSYFGGSLAHVHVCDGYAYAASDFGETDATSGIWIAKTSPSVTYGTNGGFYKFASGALGTDSSGEGNTMTVSGTMTTTKDTPDSNFATINPLNRQSGADGDIIYTNGNTTIYDNGANWRSAYGTQGDNTGKYYFETKIVGASGNWWAGVVDANQMSETDAKFVAETRGYGVNASGNRGNSGSEVSWTGEIATAQNEVVMVAVDMVNGKIYFGSQGVWMASGDPTSGSTGTGAAYSITTGHFYLPAFALYSTTAGVSANFGNGYFGTTAITSAGTNAAGYGLFEYDVPTGYTAFCTDGYNV